ncbi:hypothetical protein [Pseudoduganella sp. HUAS MS19]
MNYPLLLALAAGLAGPAAGAPSLEEYRRLPECRLSADGQRLLREPCRTAPVRKNMPRRPVPLTVTPTPRIAPAPDPSLTWAPILTRRDPHAAPTAIAQLPRAGQAALAPGAVLPPAPPLPGPSAPIPVQCDAGGCRDTSGTYYHGPPGQLVSPGGKVCSQSGGWMTCY